MNHNSKPVSLVYTTFCRKTMSYDSVDVQDRVPGHTRVAFLRVPRQVLVYQKTVLSQYPSYDYSLT